MSAFAPPVRVDEVAGTESEILRSITEVNSGVKNTGVECDGICTRVQGDIRPSNTGTEGQGVIACTTVDAVATCELKADRDGIPTISSTDARSGQALTAKDEGVVVCSTQDR